MPVDREPDPADSLPLFVYGTLRTGGSEARRMRGAASQGQTTVEGVLYDFGRYPALVPAPGSLVHGEIWRCTPETLSRLDTYEGIAEGLFDRVRLDSAAGPCWAYVAGRRLMNRLAGATIVPSGRWSDAGLRSP